MSAAARDKLFSTYRLKDDAEPIMREVDAAVLIGFIRDTAGTQLPFVVHSLKRAEKLTPELLMTALRDGLIDFFVAALSARSGARIEHVRSVVLRGGSATILPLLARSDIPAGMLNDFWNAIQAARDKAG